MVLVLLTHVVALTIQPKGKEAETMIPKTYRCGKDCGEDMGSADPAADAMPHTFAPHIAAASAKDMDKHMNANSASVNIPPHRFFPDQGLTEQQQIPYESPGHITALRRPCNLDEVLKLLKQVKDDYHAETKADAEFS